MNKTITHNLNLKKTGKVSKNITNNAIIVIWKLFRTMILLSLGFIIIYPLIYSIAMTFRPSDQIYDPTVIWVSKSLTFENLINALSIMEYSKAITISLRVNIVSAIISIIVTSLTGYGFARFKFKGKELLFIIVLLTILVPPQVIVTPLFLTYRNFGIVNTVWTFYLPALFGAGIKSGLFIFIFRQFFRGFPKELEEAAAIDGCGLFGAFIKIIIPNAKSVFLTTILLGIVWYWNDYYLSSVYMNNLNTVTTALLNLRANSTKLTGDIAIDPYKIITLMQAGSLMAVFPPLLIYVFLQRKFIQGVEKSGIVG